MFNFYVGLGLTLREEKWRYLGSEVRRRIFGPK
jgi:hypothetical protein